MASPTKRRGHASPSTNDQATQMAAPIEAQSHHQENVQEEASTNASQNAEDTQVMGSPQSPQYGDNSTARQDIADPFGGMGLTSEHPNAPSEELPDFEAYEQEEISDIRDLRRSGKLNLANLAAVATGTSTSTPYNPAAAHTYPWDPKGKRRMDTIEPAPAFAKPARTKGQFTGFTIKPSDTGELEYPIIQDHDEHIDDADIPSDEDQQGDEQGDDDEASDNEVDTNESSDDGSKKGKRVKGGKSGKPRTVHRINTKSILAQYDADAPDVKHGVNFVKEKSTYFFY